MPPQKAASSGLFGKLGKDKLKKAFDAHKNDDTTYGNMGDPPPGIENGVAQLVDAKFDKYKPGTKNAGEYYFFLAGVIVEPKEFTDGSGNVHKPAGMRVSLIEPICDTPDAKSRQTVEDHLAYAMNEMRKLGLDTSELNVEDLETAVAALKESAPFFKYRTWMGAATPEYPNPRVNTNWLGKCDAPSGDDDDGVIDETSGAAKSEEPNSPQESEEDDLEALVETAANGSSPEDEAAQARLQDLALTAGVGQDAVANAQNWQEVADLITAARSATPSAPVEEDWKPEVKEIYRYQPTDPKTKKPATDPKTKKPKLIDVEVTAVSAKDKTVSVKDVDTGKLVFKGISWEALQAAS